MVEMVINKWYFKIQSLCILVNSKNQNLNEFIIKKVDIRNKKIKNKNREEDKHAR